MLHDMESPVDLPESVILGGRPLLWTSSVIAVACALLLAMNAVALSDWIDDMAPTPAQAQAAMVADTWRDWTDAVGLGTPRAWLHARWKAIEAARF